MNSEADEDDGQCSEANGLVAGALVDGANFVDENAKIQMASTSSGVTHSEANGLVADAPVNGTNLVDENAAIQMASNSSGIDNASMNLISFSPSTSVIENAASTSTLGNANSGDEVVKAISDLRFAPAAEEDDIIEEDYGSSADEADGGSKLDDSDVILVSEYVFATEAELALTELAQLTGEPNIKPED